MSKIDQPESMSLKTMEIKLGVIERMTRAMRLAIQEQVRMIAEQNQTIAELRETMRGMILVQDELRRSLRGIRDEADGWINFINNCSGPVPTTVSDVVRTFQEMARKGLGEA